MASRRSSATPVVGFDAAWRDFILHRKAEHTSPHTLQSYQAAAFGLRDWLAGQRRSTAPADIDRQSIQEYLGHLIEAYAASTAATRYWGLRAFFEWLVEEGELDTSPLERVKPPRMEEKAPPVLTDDEVRRLLRACEGRGFEQRRDTAIIRLLFDTGMRVGELVGMTVDSVDVENGTALVMGKGRRQRAVAFGSKTAQDISRLVRIRAGHPHASMPQLWLTRKGALTASGVGQMLTRRAAEAGIERVKVHPHLFRHTFANSWKASGGSEEDLMSLGGWRSPTVMRRYASSMASVRAIAAHRQISPGDRL